MNKAEFLAIDGHSGLLAVLQYPSGDVNPPHTYPRVAESRFFIGGCLEVGFVGTIDVLFTQSLHIGDAFVFPKGLVHYQYNADPQKSATAVSAFDSASACMVSLPVTLFATNVDDVVLAKSFNTDDATIQKLKAGLEPKT